MSKPFIALVGLTLTGTVAWLKLNEEQKERVKEVIKVNRRKLANLIAPSEDLGDLTNAVDPAVLQEIAAFCNATPGTEEA